MPTIRRAAPAVAAGLLGATALCAAPPATARDTLTTSTVAEPSVRRVVFGETVDVAVDVESSSGYAPAHGTSTLRALQAGSTSWTTVATSSSPGGDFFDVQPSANTTYKVVYSGYEDDSPNGDTWTSSESTTFVIGVARRITHPTRGFTLKGTVTPEYAGKPVTIRVSRSRTKGFTGFRIIRTDASGRYSFTLPKRDGTWYWRVSARGDVRFRPSGYTWQTRLFH